MKMYDIRDVEGIIEKFLARQFNFDYVTLSTNQLIEIKNISEDYGIEVENIEEQYYS